MNRRSFFGQFAKVLAGAAAVIAAPVAAVTLGGFEASENNGTSTLANLDKYQHVYYDKELVANLKNDTLTNLRWTERIPHEIVSNTDSKRVFFRYEGHCK